MPEQANKMKLAVGDSPSPDLSLWYSSAELYQMAEAYGETGRATYVKTRYSFDLLWPLVYTAFLLTSLSWLFSGLFKKEEVYQRVNLLPLAALILDYLENLATSVVMLRYPSKTVFIDQIAPLFTLLKWLTLSASFLALAFGLILFLWRKFKPQMS
jgi:hypothetical protein